MQGQAVVAGQRRREHTFDGPFSAKHWSQAPPQRRWAPRPETNNDPGAVAIDDKDGELSDKIETYDESITPTKPDTFKIWYVVKDAAENITTKKRTVYVKEGEDTEEGNSPEEDVEGNTPEEDIEGNWLSL